MNNVSSPFYGNITSLDLRLWNWVTSSNRSGRRPVGLHARKITLRNSTGIVVGTSQERFL